MTHYTATLNDWTLDEIMAALGRVNGQGHILDGLPAFPKSVMFCGFAEFAVPGRPVKVRIRRDVWMFITHPFGDLPEIYSAYQADDAVDDIIRRCEWSREMETA